MIRKKRLKDNVTYYTEDQPKMRLLLTNLDLQVELEVHQPTYEHCQAAMDYLLRRVNTLRKGPGMR